jgi:HSP20 family protein
MHMTLLDWTFSPISEFERMRREMDELFERFGVASGAGTGFPAANIYDRGEEILVAVEVPGVPKDGLKVDLRDNALTISGTRNGADYKDASALRRELPAGEFTKTLRLPVKVAAERIEAHCKNGILLVRMPKSEESKPRQIAINA